MKKILLLSLLFASPAFADMEKAFKAEQDGNFDAAYNEFMSEAEAGNTEAMVMIALYYAQGQHVEEDLNKSNEWMLKAANLGDATAELNIGFGYQNGIGNLPKDAIIALKWFISAAEKGHAQGQFETAIAYHYGIGTARDLEKARTWYESAAEQNHPNAQNNLAGIYGEGQGVIPDPAKARELLEKSAKSNNHEALFTLGLIYHQAMDVTQDYKRAADYFRRAFIEGKSESASFLAEYYYQGNGVGQSRINAMMWLMLGTEFNSTMPGGRLSQETVARLDENKRFLTLELSPSEMTRAKGRKEDFIKKNLESKINSDDQQ